MAYKYLNLFYSDYTFLSITNLAHYLILEKKYLL